MFFFYGPYGQLSLSTLNEENNTKWWPISEHCVTDFCPTMAAEAAEGTSCNIPIFVTSLSCGPVQPELQWCSCELS